MYCYFYRPRWWVASYHQFPCFFHPRRWISKPKFKLCGKSLQTLAFISEDQSGASEEWVSLWKFSATWRNTTCDKTEFKYSQCSWVRLREFWQTRWDSCIALGKRARRIDHDIWRFCTTHASSQTQEAAECDIQASLWQQYACFARAYSCQKDKHNFGWWSFRNTLKEVVPFMESVDKATGGQMTGTDHLLSWAEEKGLFRRIFSARYMCFPHYHTNQTQTRLKHGRIGLKNRPSHSSAPKVQKHHLSCSRHGATDSQCAISCSLILSPF